MSIAPLTITGVSQFSNDLQSILNRAVQIAQIPIKQLQNRDSDILQQKALLGSINTDTASLAASLQALGTLAANQAVTGTSSDPTLVSVLSTSGSTPTSYTIDSITSFAAAASERSLAGYADASSTPVSSTGTLNLTVGSNDYRFSLATNTLVGLRDKINTLGAGVAASILTTSDGNYLAITATATGAGAIALHDDPDNANTTLLTSTNPGSDAQFSLNGIDITQKGNVVNSVIPGVTFQLLGSTNSPVTITLATDRSQLSSILQTFVGGYNTLKADLNAQAGAAAGLLTGNSIVIGLQNTLRQIASYQGATGSVRNLANLGVTFDSSGTASFDQSAFNALSDIGIADGFSFLGSAASKFGGLSKSLTQFSDPIEGLIAFEIAGINRTDQNIQTQVATLTDRVNLMQTNLARQLARADTLLAQLQSQQQTLTASLQGLSLVLYGKNPNQ